MDDRTEAALRGYSAALGLEPYQREDDGRAYDMSQRLRLADIIVRDGHKTVVDLGSQMGGMSYALKAAGVKRAVSTEHILPFCKKYLRKINDDVVLCDSFRLPFRESRLSLGILSEPDRTPLKLDALVSYMFLGQNMGQNRPPYLLGNPDGLKDVFKRLSGNASVIYSVERQSEYSRWFDPEWYDMKKRTVFGHEELKKKLEGALSPDFEVESLGGFGLYQEYPDAVEGRLGFKFTRKA